MNNQTTATVPSFIVRMYGNAIESLSTQLETRRQAVAMYGNTGRARFELAGWIKNNSGRLDGARATLAKISKNTPDGISMADVKAAWAAPQKLAPVLEFKPALDIDAVLTPGAVELRQVADDAQAKVAEAEAQIAQIEEEIAKAEAIKAKRARAARPQYHTGDLHDGDRNLRDTAKLVRKDIKAAQKSGALPRGKYSVRIERFSQGQAIRVSLVELTQSTLLVNPDRVRVQAASPNVYSEKPVHSAAGREILDTLASILSRYNRSYDDKHHSFYTTVSFDFGLEQKQEAYVLSIPTNIRISARRWS